MKRKKFYTIIFSGDSFSSLKKITVQQKYAHIILAVLISLALLFTVFLTDYLGIYIDKWELSQLKKKNQGLEKKLADLNSHFNELEKKVYKISDFSKKLQIITNTSSEHINQQMGIGKIHSSSEILALSSYTPAQKVFRSPNSQNLNQKFHEKNHYSETSPLELSNALEVRIEELKGKSDLVKQDIWTLYTDLLEKQEILNNTPSILPVKGWVSSHFGYRNETIYSDHEPHFHRGVDIASTEGNPVVSAADGKIVYTGYDDYGYGNLIVIDHGYGLKTYYAHLSKIETKIGKQVQRGEIIARVGSTGKSTGPHLHYEVRIFGIPVNPDNYILDQTELFVY